MSEISRIEKQSFDAFSHSTTDADAMDFEALFKSAKLEAGGGSSVTPVSAPSGNPSMTDILSSAISRGAKDSRRIAGIHAEMRHLSQRNDPLDPELMAKKAALAMETAQAASELNKGVMFLSKTVQGVNSLLKMQ
jgi:hypothetical protein